MFRLLGLISMFRLYLTYCFVCSRREPIAQFKTTLSSSQTFACLCSHTNTSVANPTLPDTTPSSSTPDESKIDPNGTQRNLLHYFNGRSGKYSTAVSTPFSTSVGPEKRGTGQGMRIGCGGTIKVTVEDDSSHPLGIKGHRIVINVEH